MNLDFQSGTTTEAATMVIAPAADSARLAPRIERCEFETLLQRAMEILNARHLAAQLAVAEQK
jgi:hypothetical protein